MPRELAIDTGPQLKDSFRVDRDSQTLTWKVGHILRNAILNGQFGPGQRLVERNLCELTGVSRTAVREALRSLESEGLVVNVPNRGPMVASISRSEAEDIYAVRSILEVKAIELFVSKATKAQVSALGEHLKGMEVANQRGDVELVNGLKKEFYGIFVGGCGNQIIAQMLNQLYGKISVLRHMTMAQENRSADAIAEMRSMYEAIKSRDVTGAKKACLSHVKSARAAALDALTQRETLAIPK